MAGSRYEQRASCVNQYAKRRCRFIPCLFIHRPGRLSSREHSGWIQSTIKPRPLKIYHSPSPIICPASKRPDRGHFALSHELYFAPDVRQKLTMSSTVVSTVNVLYPHVDVAAPFRVDLQMPLYNRLNVVNKIRACSSWFYDKEQAGTLHPFDALLFCRSVQIQPTIFNNQTVIFTEALHNWKSFIFVKLSE